jgi:hypothetical protein
MINKLRLLFAAHKRAKEQQEQLRVLVDQLRQIEWRLAMCRSCAVDVNAAHAIAFEALAEHGAEPWMDSASRYAIKKNAR